MSTDPTRLSVSPQDPQSWNRYTYANNNPLAFIDRNGMWSTPVHGEIIDESLGSKLSKSDREWVKQGQRLWRRQHTPTDAHSPWHDQWNNVWWGGYEPVESFAHAPGELSLGPSRNRAQLKAVLDVSRLWVRFNMALIDERKRHEEEEERPKQEQVPQQPMQ